MWLLNSEQAARLIALQRRRDLQRVGAALADVFPDAAKRAGERWAEFIEHGTARAAAYRLSHLLCVARFLAGWIACGSEFEARQPWAAAILTDDQRSEGAKVYQLCIRVLEHLRSTAQPGQGSGADFLLALKRLDEMLASAGTLASLLPRERIRLGAACDLDAAELRLVGTDWRQHYTAEGGAWRREAITLAGTSVTLLHDAGAEASPSWPAQVTLLSRRRSCACASRPNTAATRCCTLGCNASTRARCARCAAILHATPRSPCRPARVTRKRRLRTSAKKTRRSSRRCVWRPVACARAASRSASSRPCSRPTTRPSI